MDIRELERAIKAAVRMDPKESTQLALAGANGIGIQLPQEFALAAKTLSERTSRVSGGESILRKAIQWG